MKIALFSLFNSQNHGSVLQACALASVIKQYGHSCEYIQWDYCKRDRISKAIFILRHPLFIKQLIDFKKTRRNDLDFSFFSEPEYRLIANKNADFVKANTPVSQLSYTFDELVNLNSKYDLFMVGSDQTWSKDNLLNCVPYYLTFVKDNQKKVSYASSIGSNTISKDFLRFLKKRLISFNYLSCRELCNSQTLETELGKPVTHVLDPTLLLNSDDWSKYMKIIEMPEQYILCYILGERQCVVDYAQRLGMKKNLPVYYIQTRPFSAKQDNPIKGVDAGEFLYLIKNCSCLVTDSYHGTIFAINFKKDFYSFNKYDGSSLDNGRIVEVLDFLGLKRRFVEDNKSSNLEPIDYENVHSKLKVMRTKSLNYLEHILAR